MGLLYRTSGILRYMNISVITLFPLVIQPFFTTSIMKRATEAGKVSIKTVDLRDFALDSYGTVDDRPYGGGAGMGLRIEPLYAALKQVDPSHRAHRVITSPRGAVWNQSKAVDYAKKKDIVIIAGHYEGFDDRIMPYLDEEVSVGDYVMTGGELAAAAMVDSVVRLLPGVLKKEDAATVESFMRVSVDALTKALDNASEAEYLRKQGMTTVRLLEYPHFTRPQNYEHASVPEVLLSGNPRQLRTWQLREAYRITKARRPDLLGPQK